MTTPNTHRDARSLRAIYGLVAVILLSLFSAACGDDDSGAGDSDVATSTDTTFGADAVLDIVVDDTTSPSDTGASSDTAAVDTASDTATSDTTQPADTGPTQDTSTPPGKADPTYLVPLTVSAKSWLTGSGSVVAWLETDPVDGPRFAFWNLAEPAEEPTHIIVANLANPRELALGPKHLAYTDNRFGDDDVFVLDLATGKESPVGVGAGPQRSPSLTNESVAFESCDKCPQGAPFDDRNIVVVDLVSGDRTTLGKEDVADRRPVFGTLGTGETALAWIEGASRLRVRSLDGSLELDWDVSSAVFATTLEDGVLAWRPSPSVINPDSMMPAGVINPDSMIPSDLFLTDADDGATVSATFHAERRVTLDPTPVSASGRIGWASSQPGDPFSTLIQAADVSGTILVGVTEREAHTVAVTDTHLGFIAPRSDNADQDDVWLLPWPP